MGHSGVASHNINLLALPKIVQQDKNNTVANKNTSTRRESTGKGRGESEEERVHDPYKTLTKVQSCSNHYYS